jgi:hypothetical protein
VKDHRNLSANVHVYTPSSLVPVAWFFGSFIFLIMPLLLRASVAFPFKIPPGGAKLSPGPELV